MEQPYVHTEKIHNTNAAEVVVPIILEQFTVKSVLDVGCGLGTWLKVFQDAFNINDILGLDGAYLDKSKLAIESAFFKEIDLKKPFDLKREYDLVISLEVAEHLPEHAAVGFVESLCKHGDTIIFSAAIPAQGGQNHINEQWPDYWESLFLSNGFVQSDVLRPLIWNNSAIEVWYRQNIFVYKKSRGKNLNPNALHQAWIHPEMWTLKTNALLKANQEVKNYENGIVGVKMAFRVLVRALKRKLLP